MKAGVMLLVVVISVLMPWMPCIGADFGDSLVVIISGNMRGRATGCGCPSGPQGGLDRRATLLRENFGITGNFGVDCGGILDLDPAGGMNRSRCTIEELATQGLKVIGANVRDLYYGVDYLKKTTSNAGVKVVCANLVKPGRNSELLFDEWSIFEHSGQIYAIAGLSAFQPPKAGVEPGSWMTLQPDSVLARLQQSKPKRSTYTILLTDLDEAALRQLLTRTTIFDLAITGSRQVYSATPFTVGRTAVLHPETDGKALEAWIRSGKRPNGGRAARWMTDVETPPDNAARKRIDDCLKIQPVKSGR
jgi:hypothetical protein